MGADQHNDWRASVASALEWWRDAGVDCEIDEAPRDWLARLPSADKLPSAVREEPAEMVKLPETLADFADWRIGPAAPEAGWPGKALGDAGDAASGLMIVADMPDREDEAAGDCYRAAPDGCSTRCSPRSGATAHRSIWPRSP